MSDQPVQDDPRSILGPNPGRRRYTVNPSRPNLSLSNLRRTEELPYSNDFNVVTNAIWILDDEARQRKFDPLLEGDDDGPFLWGIDNVYVVLNTVIGFKNGGQEHEVHNTICNHLKKKLGDHITVEKYDDNEGSLEIIRCEEGDERRLLKSLRDSTSTKPVVKIGRNQYMTITPGSPLESPDGRYNNCRLRIGFMLYRGRSYGEQWYKIYDLLMRHAFRTKRDDTLLFQPQVHPPHMSIAFSFGAFPQYWIKKLAKAVVLFEEYIDQVHAFILTNPGDKTTIKEKAAGAIQRISGEEVIDRKRRPAAMHRYWNDNRDMSNRWNRILRRLSRRQCLNMIDKCQTIWDVVQVMNPRPLQDPVGVFPDYKWDFTGLLTLGGYLREPPLHHDVHNMVVARQCIFTCRDIDTNWIQRLTRFVTFAIQRDDKDFNMWVNPANISHGILRKIGMDVYEPEFKLLAAYDTASEWIKDIPGASPIPSPPPTDPTPGPELANPVPAPQPPRGPRPSDDELGARPEPRGDQKYRPPLALSGDEPASEPEPEPVPVAVPPSVKSRASIRSSIPDYTPVPSDDSRAAALLNEIERQNNMLPPIFTEVVGVPQQNHPRHRRTGSTKPGGSEVIRQGESKRLRAYRRVRLGVINRMTRITGKPPKKFI